MRRPQSVTIVACIPIAAVATAAGTTSGMLPCALSAPSGKKTVQGWKVEQSSHLEGPVTFYLSSAGAKMLCPSQHLACIALPPKWEVRIVNQKEKIGMVISNNLWRIKGFRLVDKVKSEEKSRTPTKWHGKPALLAIRSVNASDPIKEQAEMLYRDSPSRSAEFTAEQYIYEKFLKFEPGIQNFLCGIYGVREYDGLLLRRLRNYQNKRVDAVIDTTSLLPAAIPMDEFVYPTNYKIARSMNEVTQQRKKIMESAGMLEDMFLEK